MVVTRAGVGGVWGKSPVRELGFVAAYVGLGGGVGEHPGRGSVSLALEPGALVHRSLQRPGFIRICAGATPARAKTSSRSAIAGLPASEKRLDL